MTRKRKHIRTTRSKKKKDTIDKLIYPAAIATPILTLPQVYIIWVNKETGSSLITWAAYSVIALIWLLYAIKTRDKPLIVLELPSLILYVMITIGLFII